MDQQNPKRVYTAEEIARLEAEAVAALQKGETPPKPESSEPDEAEESPSVPGFVPYVDDVPEAPQAAPAQIEPAVEPEGDAPDDEEDYVPGPWEERVNRLTDRQWKLAQIIGGALLGAVAIGLLFIGGEELATYRLIIAALAALLVPRYLERVLRRELNVARKAMIVAMLVCLVAAFLIIGIRTGFNFSKAPQ